MHGELLVSTDESAGAMTRAADEMDSNVFPTPNSRDSFHWLKWEENECDSGVMPGNKSDTSSENLSSCVFWSFLLVKSGMNPA